MEANGSSHHFANLIENATSPPPVKAFEDWRVHGPVLNLSMGGMRPTTDRRATVRPGR